MMGKTESEFAFYWVCDDWENALRLFVFFSFSLLIWNDLVRLDVGLIVCMGST